MLSNRLTKSTIYIVFRCCDKASTDAEYCCKPGNFTRLRLGNFRLHSSQRCPANPFELVNKGTNFLEYVLFLD